MSIPVKPYIRYKAHDFNNRIWYQSSDSSRTPVVNISVTDTTIDVSYNTIGYGANNIFKVVQGTSISTKIVITDSNIQNYTLFSVARYNGNNKSRIITTNTYNGLYGFHLSKNGVAYHDSWLTQYENTFTDVNNWILSTDYAYNYRCNGIPLVVNGVVGNDYLPPISINGYEPSDYQVADIIIYNSNLSFSNILKVESYLFNLYGFSGYYYNNINLYSLYMPKLNVPTTNYYHKWFQIFYKR